MKIVDPTGKRLQGEETDRWLPSHWHLVIVHRVRHGVEFFRHDDFTDKGLLDFSKHLSHDNEESVVLEQFLGQYSVHRLIVISGVLLLNFFNIEGRRSLLLDGDRDLGNQLLSGLSCATGNTGLDGKHVLKNESCRTLVGSDLSVLVKTEGLSSWVERE